MAFTAGSVELARATRLGQKLVNYNNAFGLTTGTNSRDDQLISKLCRNGRFFPTGYTTGNAFPPFQTNNTVGLTHSNNAATYNLGITLGTNVGFTLGVAYKTAGGAGAIGDVTFGLVLPSSLYGLTAAVNIVTGDVS